MDRDQGYPLPDMPQFFNRVDSFTSSHHVTFSNVENYLNHSSMWLDLNKHHFHAHHARLHQLQLRSTVPNQGNIPDHRSTPFLDNTGMVTKGLDSLEINQREEMLSVLPSAETYTSNGGNLPLMNFPFGHHHHHVGYCHVHHGHYLPPTWGHYGVNHNGGFLSGWGYPATRCFPGRTLLYPSSYDMGALLFNNQYNPQLPASMHNSIGHDFGVHMSYGLPVDFSLSVGIQADPMNSRQIFSSANISYPRSIRRLPQSTSDATLAQMRISSREEMNEVAFPSFYGAENFFDRHSDMRLDIDGMSYEELLALGEQIGQVKIGLSKEMVLRKLKTRCFSMIANNTPDPGSCIICQAEYLEKERIGTLSCGHEYHADCIIEWLLVKNQCPVCKSTAVSIDERER